MSDMFSDEGIKNMASQNLQVFPDHPISPGDTWTREGEQNISQLGKSVTKTTYEYVGPKDVNGSTLQEVKATMETDFSQGMPEVPGATIEVEDQKMSGVILFDNELGRMTKSDFDIELKSTLTIMGQTVGQQIKGKVETTMAPPGEAADADTGESDAAKSSAGSETSK
ncbi:MAG: DUF6263 family protein [Pirellulales bacterium]